MDVGVEINKNPSLFRFELGWFLRDDIDNVVSNIWRRSFPGRFFFGLLAE